jgi:hypothetical protein
MRCRDWFVFSEATQPLSNSLVRTHGTVPVLVERLGNHPAI